MLEPFFSGCPLGNVQATALKTCEKLTLGKMNCSTGLYHTPFTMVPVLMALKRAVTTASCKKKNKKITSFHPSDNQECAHFIYTEYYSTDCYLKDK